MQTSIYIPNALGKNYENIRIGNQFRSMILSREVKEIEVTAEYDGDTQILVLSELEPRYKSATSDYVLFHTPTVKPGWNIFITLDFKYAQNKASFINKSAGGSDNNKSVPVSMTFSRYKIEDTWYSF